MSALNSIGTDARVRGLPQWQYFQGPEPDIDDVGDSPTKNWNEVIFSSAVSITEYRPGKSFNRHHWETTFVVGPYSALPKNRKAETAYIYEKGIVHMGADKMVSIHNLVGSEFCISSNNGKRVSDTIRSVLSKGNKVRISFRDVKSLSAAFLDAAIGQLYNGEIQGNIDDMLSFEDISPGRRLIVDEAIREAKEYYNDPKGYAEKMKELFADD